MLTRCFLDVDGVLADFVGGIHNKLHLDFDYNRWPYAKGPKGWHFHDEIGMSFMEMSELCDFDFWKNLRWTPDGRDLLRIVTDYFNPDQITLLTTPMPNVMSASGKIAWIAENLPAYFKHVGIWTEAKHVLARVPNSVLIDDGSCNVRDWYEAGGKAVLVPRPWNIGWMTHEDGRTMMAVERRLEDLCRRY